MDISKEYLQRYIGSHYSELPTPSVLLQKSVVEENCANVLKLISQLSVKFRAHVKTHKTVEITKLMLGGEHKSVIVSTLREARGLLPLVQEGLIDNVLYGVPFAPSTLPEVERLSASVKMLLMIDNEEQVSILESKYHGTGRLWEVFIKVDMGSQRAGIAVKSPRLRTLIQRAHASDVVRVHGFYCHAGHAYKSKNKNDAALVLKDEVNAAVEAAKLVDLHHPIVLSVGATPTIHVMDSLKYKIPSNCSLEFHGGNYCLNDLQQVATGTIKDDRQAMRLLAEIASIYPERNEALVNAGVLAISRESGPSLGFGKVQEAPLWKVGRMWQEHGILVSSAGNESAQNTFKIGQKVKLLVPHACITGSSYDWYFVMDDHDHVCDIWSRWRGW